MTETAAMADIVLPATMFMEHSDLYQGGGHTHAMWSGKLIDPPEGCRDNHRVVCDLARRVGAEHPAFAMSVEDIVDATLQASGRGTLEALRRDNWADVAPPWREAHCADGFAWPDGRFRFMPDWTSVPAANAGAEGPWAEMPRLPDQWDVIEAATPEHPFRLATSPARHFLNSTFTETPGSASREGQPTLLIRPDDAAAAGVGEGGAVRVANGRGAVTLTVKLFEGLRPGVVIAESVHPNAAHPDGCGINTLVGADAVAPYGGAAFHDVAVSLSRA
jgi:anaerobic selenocysteine-containing dehydrogenase